MNDRKDTIALYAPRGQLWIELPKTWVWSVDSDPAIRGLTLVRYAKSAYGPTFSDLVIQNPDLIRLMLGWPPKTDTINP